ncbi:cytochrome c oxidase subunit II [Candidatus Cyanaurora vandensis]|uniref:cytochrome c oxidase subunit II n=1 Tax=Candidatus Cyanaurora vandensis TaxID=2714958 RepID=UPI00257D85D5|nr:cytochrome c oxidase subunit II [Candidatus Cyanaurora vandensis]
MRIPRIPTGPWVYGAGLTIVLLLTYWVGVNADFFLPIAAAEEAPPIDGLFRFMLVVGAGISFFVIGVLLYAALAFRREPGETGDGQPVEGVLTLEVLWTAIPTALVLFISISSYNVYQEISETASLTAGHTHTTLLSSAEAQDDTPAVRDAAVDLEIQVEAQQWAWLFTYPGVKVPTGELHLPVDQEVRLVMRSKDVLHGFWVPEFRLKQDVIPGQTTSVRFRPTKTGTYVLNCTQLCGAYHGAMKVEVKVETIPEYQRWLKEQAAVQP